MAVFKRRAPGHERPPWVLRVPSVFQTNSSLIFIALMCTIAGLAALFGFSDPQSITSKMSLPFYQVWGASLTIAGGLLVYGIVIRDVLIEKYAARVLSLGLVSFIAWAVAAVGFRRAFTSVSLGGCIVFFLEQRISFINVIMYARRITGKIARSHIDLEEGGSDEVK